MVVGRSRFSYSRWDGTQVGFDLDADAVLAEINDDILYHGDLNAALRRLLHTGFSDRNGEHVEGMRDLLDRLRRARRERLERYDLGGVFGDVAERIREVIDIERRALDDLEREAVESGDARRAEVTADAVADRRMQLDLLPPDLAGTVRELSDRYDFTSSEARERFEELTAELREQLAKRWFDQMSSAMTDVSPESLQRTKDMLAELNRMLQDRAAGRTPDFESFMERYGDMFPEAPRDLDELLEAMARRMAAMQSMLNSMTPDQRAQLQALSDQLLDDLDLRWQFDQLSTNLRNAFPDLPWNRRFEFEGQDPLGFADAAQVMNELGDLDRIEGMMRDASSPGALAEIDLDRVRDLVGPEAAASLDRMAEFARLLEEAGLIENRGGRYELTPAGLRRVGSKALEDLFSKMARDKFGQHRLQRAGLGHERSTETKAYEFGDPFNLQIERTIRNAIARRGGGTPVRLTPEDFEVEQTEQTVRSATVLMLDLSLSMPMRENFLPAKKVAMALHSLISSRFPRDYLGIVGFSEVARVIGARDLPEASWDYVYGTNMQHGFQLARRLLAREHGTKQIIMITDGEPTAHIGVDGEPVFHYPPLQETVDATLQEVLRATREGIRINTFVLDATPWLEGFVEKMTELNRGRAFFTTNDALGDYVLVDFLESRRNLTRRGSWAG